MNQEYVCSITPTEFELYCKKILEGYAEENGLNEFKINHNIKITANDGVYQIDVYASFIEIGVEFKVICECKQYKNKVGRDKVELLYTRLSSLGAHKGILMSTSGFQSGAIQYAKEHGIALIQVFDSSCITYAHSVGLDSQGEDSDPFYYAERNMPKYSAIDLSVDKEEPERVYPTKRMVRELVEKQYEMIKEEIRKNKATRD